MPTYVIGDLQGCLDPLQRLLEKLKYNPNQDILWFTGDLINRGTQSLATLRFVHQLPATTVCVLGNHDLTLIAAYYGKITPKPHDTYQEILTAPDADLLIQWLMAKPLLHEEHDYVLTHAGIYPLWDLPTARACAGEAEKSLTQDTDLFLSHLFGNTPEMWHPDLTFPDRQRFIINALTRMRFCDENGALDFDSKENITSAPTHLIPWYEHPKRKRVPAMILFGHWAALQGACPVDNIIALDSGCVWGNALTAFCLETQQKTSVPC